MIGAARMTKRVAALSLRAWAGWAGQAALMTALTGSRMSCSVPPFAVACFAAGRGCGWPPLPMLLGCALHGLLSGQTVQAAAALLGCAVALALNAVARGLIKKEAPGQRDALIALGAGVGALLPGFALAGGIPYNYVTALLAAAVSALLAPALTDALSLSPERRRLLPEERLSCALLAEMTLIGLCSMPRAGGWIAEAAAVFATLVMASRGPAMGALGGIACGAALALGTGVAPAGSALGLAGLVAGCARHLPRPAAALALALGNGLALTSGIGFTLGGVGLGPLLAGAALYCVLPKKRLRRIGRLLEDARPHCDPARLAMRLRRETGERLSRLSAAFQAMAQGCAGEEEQPDEAALVARMRSALCEGCAGYGRCWQGDHPEAGRLLCRLLSEALNRGEAPPLSERPPELARHCRRSAQIDRRFQPLLAELAAESRLRRRRSDLKGVVSRQLTGAAAELAALAGQLKKPASMNEDMARVAAAALDKAGLHAVQVSACEENGLEICAALKNGLWDGGKTRRAAAVLEEELGVRLVCRARSAGKSWEAVFRQAPSLCVRSGVSVSAAKEGGPCGDAARVLSLPDGRLAAVLSDGMGRGESAAGESRKTVDWLCAFLAAGLGSAASLEAVNALLQARRGDELFATVDLCVIDLTGGETCLTKLGACPSLLITKGRAERLAGGRLPIGILESVEPDEQRLCVRAGDTLIMYSDGVADELFDGQSEWLRETALSLAALDPEALARRLRQAAEAHHGRKDDMSVVVIRVEKR